MNNISALCSKNIGVAFYFYQKPSLIKENINTLISRYCEINNQPMSYFSLNDGKIKSMRGKKFPQYVNSIISGYDFYNSLCTQFYNDKIEKCHDSEIEIYMSDFDSTKYFNTKHPNILYFEFPLETDLYKIYLFIENAFNLFEIFYSFCNPVISGSSLFYPKSYNMAVKQLKSNAIFSPKDGFFIHSISHQLQNHMICGESLIHFFSNTFEKDITSKLPNNIFLKKFEDHFSLSLIDFETENNMIVLTDYPENLLIERYRALNKCLSNIISYDYGKNMFFKQDEWESWIRRFE